MSIGHLLKDWAPSRGPSSFGDDLPSPEASEEFRLESYEEGYKAGWDDAVRANTSEQMQLATDLAQNLRDLSFTYQEASAHMSQSLMGVFDTMLTLFLPELARQALMPKVAEELGKLPLAVDGLKAVLSIAPENRKIMERLIGNFPDIEIALQDDPTLTSGQVLIGFGDSETSVDFDALLEEMRSVLTGFQHEAQKEKIHG